MRLSNFERGQLSLMVQVRRPGIDRSHVALGLLNSDGVHAEWVILSIPSSADNIIKW